MAKRRQRKKTRTPKGRRVKLPPGTPTTLVEGQVDGKKESWTLAGHHHALAAILGMNKKCGVDTRWLDGSGRPVVVPTSKLKDGHCRPGKAKH